MNNARLEQLSPPLVRCILQFVSLRDALSMCCCNHSTRQSVGDMRTPFFVLAVHKPRGYLSERLTSKMTGARTSNGAMDALGRPSVYSLVDPYVHAAKQGCAARAQQQRTMSGVGRLDLETSGLLIFTSDGALHRYLRGAGVSKTYVVTVSGAGVTPDKLERALASMRNPLALDGDISSSNNSSSSRCSSSSSSSESIADNLLAPHERRETKQEQGKRGSGACCTRPAHVRFLRRWCYASQSTETATASQDDEAKEDSVVLATATPAADAFVDHPTALEHWRAARRQELRLDSRMEARMDGGDGSVIDIEIRINEGKFHQVRRLIKRAGLRMRHLRRVAIGQSTLLSCRCPRPGDVSAFCFNELSALVGTAAGYEAGATG